MSNDNINQYADFISNQLVKEGVVQVDELKKSTLGSYINKAAQSKSDAESKMSNDQDWDDMTDKEQDKTVRDQKNRTKGIGKAVDKLTKEQAEVKFSEAELNAIENIIELEQTNEKVMYGKPKPPHTMDKPINDTDDLKPAKPAKSYNDTSDHSNLVNTPAKHDAPKSKNTGKDHTDPTFKPKPVKKSPPPGVMYKEDTVSLYAQFISKQLVQEGTVLIEDKEYSIDYDEPTKKQENALASAHKHITAKGYKISHDGSDDDSHKETDNPDITYHYAMGDDMHHAFTVHKNGKAAKDTELQKIAKPLEY